jgi:hypothetical protein
MGRACGTHGRGENAYGVWVIKPQEKSPFVKIRRRWKNTSRQRMRELEMNSSELAQKIPSCDHGSESSGSV